MVCRLYMLLNILEMKGISINIFICLKSISVRFDSLFFVKRKNNDNNFRGTWK